jgi:hypothetical protein
MPLIEQVLAFLNRGGQQMHNRPDRSGRPSAVPPRSERAGCVADSAIMVRTTHADGPEQEAARAVLSPLRLSAGGRLDLPPAAAEVTARWRDLIQAEVGDPVRADVVRLVGDGLFVVTLTGGAPARRAGRRARRAPARRCVVSAPLLAGILGLALLDASTPPGSSASRWILLLPGRRPLATAVAFVLGA